MTGKHERDENQDRKRIQPHLPSFRRSLDMREESNIHSQIVGSPNVTMKITDKDGNDITTAQVGDPLNLRLEITDESSKRIEIPEKSCLILTNFQAHTKYSFET